MHILLNPGPIIKNTADSAMFFNLVVEDANF